MLKDGWTAGFTQFFEQGVEIENLSIGSSGIFNAIYHLFSSNTRLDNLNAIIIDSNIQDALFFKNDIPFYFEILNELFKLLQSKGVFVFFVCFSPLEKGASIVYFEEKLKFFFDTNKIAAVFCADLISKSFNSIPLESSAQLYTDNHHLSASAAKELGHMIAPLFLDSYLSATKTLLRKTEPLPNPFAVLNFENTQILTPRTRKIKNSLISANTIILNETTSQLESLVPLADHEVIGIVFNAHRSSGWIRIGSDSAIVKNLSNVSSTYWDKDLIWCRPLHTRVRTNGSLTLQMLGSAKEFESTEFCEVHQTDSELTAGAELIALIAMKIPAERDHRINAFVSQISTPITNQQKRLLANLFEAKQYNELIAIAETCMVKLPENAFLHKVLGSAYLQKNQLHQAIENLEICISLDIKDFESFNSLATAHRYSGKKEFAIQLYQQAIELNPSYLPAILNLIDTFGELEMTAEALHFIELCMLRKIAETELLSKKAELLSKLENFDGAISAWKTILPTSKFPEKIHNDIGTAFYKLDQSRFALEHYQLSLNKNPKFVPALCNLSQIEIDAGNYAVGLNYATAALLSEPHNSLALNKLAASQRGLGNFQAAEYTLRKILKLDANNQVAKANLAHILLSRGAYEEGFALHESRFSQTVNLNQKFPVLKRISKWNGQSLAGKTILLLPEQGIGDQIQFLRYVHILQDRGAKEVRLICSKPMLSIAKSFTCSNFKPVENQDEFVDSDFWCELLSLPHLLQSEDLFCRDKFPYLTADTEHAPRFKQDLKNINGIKIGICWRGAIGYKYDTERSIDIQFFSSLDKLKGARFFCLQQGGRREFLDHFTTNGFDLGHEIDSETRPFVETMALIECLDLVITCDTSIGHVSGAMGKKTWLLLPFVCDWRWGQTGVDTNWYETTQLFRQTHSREWKSVFATVEFELQHLLDSEPKETPSEFADCILVPTSLGELLDKLSILDIKRTRIRDTKKLSNVFKEFNYLSTLVPDLILKHDEINKLRSQLHSINDAIWKVEDAIRECEKRKDFGEKFIQLARSVYIQNDQRAKVKSEINNITGSGIREEKSYD